MLDGGSIPPISTKSTLCKRRIALELSAGNYLIALTPNSVLLTGMTRFRQREIVKEASGELTDLIGKIKLIANDEVYAVAA